MKKKDLNQFKERLLAQKQQILSKTEKMRSEQLSVDREDLPYEIDQASSELTKAMTLRLNDRERAVLPKIDYALEKIASGEYGVCEACGDDIGISRLEVRPFATLCIKCKEEEEHKEKMYANQ